MTSDQLDTLYFDTLLSTPRIHLRRFYRSRHLTLKIRLPSYLHFYLLVAIQIFEPKSYCHHDRSRYP